MRSLTKETQLDVKESNEVVLAVNKDRKWFQCEKTGNFKKDCPKKDSNDDSNNDYQLPIANCELGKAMGRQFFGKTRNCSEGYKSKLSFDEAKKKIVETNNSKTGVHGAYIEMNEFLCLNIDINAEDFYSKLIITRELIMSGFKTKGGRIYAKNEQTPRWMTQVMINQISNKAGEPICLKLLFWSEGGYYKAKLE